MLKELLPKHIQSEQELSELDRLTDFYSKYLNFLEEIWYDNENKVFDERSVMARFFKLKEEECDKYSNMNKRVRTISNKEMAKINEQSKEYVDRVYFNYNKN